MYDYKTEKPFIFTEEGQKMFLRVRDKANALHETAGACTIEHATEYLSGSSWSMLACVDRLVEIGEYKYLENDGCTQHRVLVKIVR
jgi:hypothetical protein